MSNAKGFLEFGFIWHPSKEQYVFREVTKQRKQTECLGVTSVGKPIEKLIEDKG